MKHPELIRQKRQLDELFAKGATLSFDPELQAHWTFYLCIRVSGFLENAVRLIFSEYAKAVAPATVVNFVESNLRKFPNPTSKAIFELADKFSRSWKVDLIELTQGRLRDSVDSIVANRHQIAHGGASSLTFRSLEIYYQDTITVIEIIESKCC